MCVRACVRVRDGETPGVKDVMNRVGPHRKWRYHTLTARYRSVLGRTEEITFWCVSCTVLVVTWFLCVGVCLCGCVCVRVL
jgi:hypothetical protein